MSIFDSKRPFELVRSLRPLSTRFGLSTLPNSAAARKV